MHACVFMRVCIKSEPFMDFSFVSCKKNIYSMCHIKVESIFTDTIQCQIQEHKRCCLSNISTAFATI